MKLDHRLVLALTFSAASLVAVGCAHETTSATTTTTSGNPAVDSAVSTIASARCEREVSCNNIGADHKYPSRQACVDDLSQSGREDLRAGQCPGGVNPQQVEKCVAEVRGERCGNPLDSLSRLASCRTDALCVK